MTALRKPMPITVFVSRERKAIAYVPFDTIETLIDTVTGMTRPIEALVPKPSGRKHTAERITFRQCRIEAQRGVHCSASLVFKSMSECGLMMPDIGFTPETLIKVLPGIIDLGPVDGVAPNLRNCFLLQDGTALTIWTPEHYPSLVALRQSWQETFLDCQDGDKLFLAA